MEKLLDNKNNKRSIKKIILVIIFIILIGILAFLIYEVKFAEKNIFDKESKYEEYDPNYELEENSNKKNEQSNINESNIISNTNSNKSNSNNVKVTGIKLNASKLSMSVGETKQLKATITPSNATNKSVVWSSSNPKVATVNSNGKIVAKTKGNTIIVAKTVDGNMSSKVTINVSDKEIPVTKLAIKYGYVSYNYNGLPGLYTYNTTNFSAVITPSNATNKSIKWSSSNPKVAKVDSNGKVTAVSRGEAIITATSSNNVKATQKIVISNNPYVFKVNCNLSGAGPMGYTYSCNAGVYDNGYKINYSSIKSGGKTYTASQLSSTTGNYSQFARVNTVTLVYHDFSYVIPVEYNQKAT